MKRIVLIQLIAGLLGVSHLCHAEGAPVYEVRCDVFRVQDSLSGDTSLTDAIWPNGKKPDDSNGKNVTWFTEARLRIGAETLEVGKDGWALNGKPLEWEKLRQEPQTPSSEKPGGRALSLIYSPRVQMGELPDDVASATSGVYITAESQFEYFEKAAGPPAGGQTLYALRRMTVKTGLGIECSARTQDERILLDGLTFTLTSVCEREPLEGVSLLSVGKPIPKETKIRTPVRLRPGVDYGMLLMPGEGQGLLLVRIRARRYTL